MWRKRGRRKEGRKRGKEKREKKRERNRRNKRTRLSLIYLVQNRNLCTTSSKNYLWRRFYAIASRGKVRDMRGSEGYEGREMREGIEIGVEKGER